MTKKRSRLERKPEFPDLQSCITMKGTVTSVSVDTVSTLGDAYLQLGVREKQGDKETYGNLLKILYN